MREPRANFHFPVMHVELRLGIGPQRDVWVDTGGAPRRQIDRNQRDTGEQRRHVGCRRLVIEADVHAVRQRRRGRKDEDPERMREIATDMRKMGDWSCTM